MATFEGKWLTSFGPMDLTQDGTRVRGVYHARGAECAVAGEVSGGRFTFRYEEPQEQGDGWFELRRHGKAFGGQYRPDGDDRWLPWDGERVGFDGLWNTSFGFLRLVEEDGRVSGHYTVGGTATVEGRRKGDRLVFRYKEPKARGRGQFDLAEDGLSFRGEWQAQGDPAHRPWWGLRVRPQPEVAWLVVLESPWQRFLSDKEYAFGHMLREFFARLPHVQVRHRFFSNEAGLRQCLRDLTFIAEPVTLVVASHGEADGVRAGADTVGMKALVESLRLAGDVRHLHFSACLTMKDPAVVARLQAFSDETGTAVSGYATSVNWAASALIEFTFLELTLGQGRLPAEAAEHLRKLLPFAGDEGVAGGAFAPAGFRIVTPSVPSQKKSRNKS